MVMPAELLRQIGEALYGERWQSALAADLRIADRTVRYWLAGRSPVPAAVTDELSRMIAARGRELQRVAEELAKL